MSIVVPSGKNGISASGIIVDIIPLLPCRPANLSPICIFLFSVIKIVIEKILFLLFIFNFVIMPDIPLGICIELLAIIFWWNNLSSSFIIDVFFFLILIFPIKISFSLIFTPIFINPFFFKFFIERKLTSGI